MTSEQLAWVAGLLEGEGCFDFNRKPYPRVRMETTDHDTALRLQAVVGGASTVNPRTKAKPHFKQSWMWRLSTASEAIALMRALYPMMSARRKQRIDEISACWNEHQAGRKQVGAVL